MSQPQPRPAMPGALKAVRVILGVELIILLILVLVLLWSLSVLGPEGLGSIWADLGLSSEALTFSLVFFLLTVALQFYVVVRLGRGGQGAQVSLRLLILLSFVGMGINLLLGEAPGITLAVYVLVACLSEGSAARGWFQRTEALP